MAFGGMKEGMQWSLVVAPSVDSIRPVNGEKTLRTETIKKPYPLKYSHVVYKYPDQGVDIYWPQLLTVTLSDLWFIFFLLIL